MIYNQSLFEQLINEAQNQPFIGWDFSYIAGRQRSGELPWDYHQSVRQAISSAQRLLDIGTGGGEFLTTLQPLPRHTYATEAYPYNVSIARKRLEPLGVEVVAVGSDDQMPFDDSFFDLIIDRHEKFIALEVARLLQPGGRFITQQVGERDLLTLNECLKADLKPRPSRYQKALAYLAQAGLEVVMQREAFTEMVFYDVGAIVYLLKAIPWQVPDFTIEKYYDRLVTIHNHIQTTGQFIASKHRYYIEARKLQSFKD
jgi:SAM-dependent methyltransferase